MRATFASGKQQAPTASAAAQARGSTRAALVLIAASAVAVAGCSQVRPYVPPSEGHIVAKVPESYDLQ